MKGQTALPSERLRKPDVSVNRCDWCDRSAVGSFPLTARVKGKRSGRVSTGMHVYFCSPHQHTAEEATREPVKRR